jgi:homoserine O-acetyltransferase
MQDYEIYNFGTVTLANRAELPEARIAFKTHGTLNDQRDNAILFPTWFGGNHRDNEWIIGPGRALDSDRFFIIVTNNFCNGISSSPSNTLELEPGSFPSVSVLDQVLLQRQMLLDRFDIDWLRMVIGRSMGAQIAYQWASYFPEAVGALVAIVGSAKTSSFNKVFLESVKLAITSNPGWNGGSYHGRLTRLPEQLRTVFDAWALSPGFYRKALYKTLGYADLQTFLRRKPPELGDANDLLAQIEIWREADISANARFGGNIQAALRAIAAPAAIIPSATDMYFTVEESTDEAVAMPRATLHVIPSLWGHRAGAPGTDPADIAFIELVIRQLLPATRRS